jgi:lysophospholipase L1-like esterase
MKFILCFGDSNTWGCTPETMERYDPSVRWPGVLQRLLGKDYLVYENGMNGRTTVFDDPIEENRCGKAVLPVILECSAPLDLVIIMLGTNDCKARFSLEPWDIAWGMDLLVQYVIRANCGRKEQTPKILIVSPPSMGNDWDKTILGTVFGPAAKRRCEQLPFVYQKIAEKNNVFFMDAGNYTEPGKDCVHLTPASHQKLAEAFAAKIKEMLK